jgi:hypothetical protein
METNIDKEITYETKFEDGSEITSYLATAYAEGFCEGEGANPTDIIKAWSYLCGTKIGYSLQGFFGRTITSLIEAEILNSDGKVDWYMVEALEQSC